MSKSTRRDFVKSAALASISLASSNGQASAAVRSRPSTRGIATERFDFVVAGAGHNSLISAGYLAKAGYRVLVLEEQAMIGGGCKTSEILLPGYNEDWCSSTHGIIANNPLMTQNELKLNDYGYEILHPEVVIHFPFTDGASFTVYLNDIERTAASIATVSKTDAETFRNLASLRTAAKGNSGTGKAQAQNYLSTLAAMSGHAAALQVWQSPQMQAAALSGGRFSGPSGAELGTGMQALSMLTHVGGRPFPKGGSGMLSVALGRLIEANNGVVLTNMPVTELVIEKGKCVGVGCADGSRFRAQKGVVSTIHPRQLLTMAPRALWGDALIQQVALMQPELAMFAFHYATTEPPRYNLSTGGMVSSPEAAAMADPASVFVPHLDAARGELHLDDYPLQICHPSVADPSRVPKGRGLIKIQGYVTYNLKGGPGSWDRVKDQIADKVLARYLKLTANLTPANVIAKHIVSPLDMERGNSAMWRGSVHGFDNRYGAFAPYRLPIAGLYQTGDCTSPGGGISGMPGRNAAELILTDQGRNIAEVVASAA